MQKILFVEPEKFTGCRICETVCPMHAIHKDEKTGTLVIDYDLFFFFYFLVVKISISSIRLKK